MRFSLIVLVLLIASLFVAGCGDTDAGVVTTDDSVEQAVTGSQVDDAVDELLVDETDDVELGELI